MSPMRVCHRSGSLVPGPRRAACAARRATTGRATIVETGRVTAVETGRAALGRTGFVLIPSRATAARLIIAAGLITTAHSIIAARLVVTACVIISRRAAVARSRPGGLIGSPGGILGRSVRGLVHDRPALRRLPARLIRGQVAARAGTRGDQHGYAVDPVELERGGQRILLAVAALQPE